VAQFEANIWSFDLTRRKLSSKPLIASTKYDSNPVWSPDGSEIAFSSNRTGQGGIWIAAADGRRTGLVYSPDGGRAVGPQWVENGTALLATEYRPGQQRIVRIALNRNEVQPLVTQGTRPYAASASPDGQWIYYLAGTNTRGSQLWRMPGHESAEASVWADGTLYWYQAADDGHVYFTRYGEPGLWRRPADGDHAPEKVLEDLPTWAADDWTVVDGWLYYPDEEGLMRRSLTDASVERVADIVPRALGSTLAVHPNGHTLLLTTTDRAETDLFVAWP
jgi:Tol biopolymer transport system component